MDYCKTCGYLFVGEEHDDNCIDCKAKETNMTLPEAYRLHRDQANSDAHYMVGWLLGALKTANYAEYEVARAEEKRLKTEREADLATNLQKVEG